MNTYDKLKLSGNLDQIRIIDSSKLLFKALGEKGNPISATYERKAPSTLKLRLDYIHHEYVMEFTGKILGNDYPRLICRDTIEKCLDTIKRLKIVDFDTQSIIHQSDVLKCDVTKDVSISDFSEIISYLKMHLSNHDRWEIAKYHNGVVLKNKASTERHKRRIVIYDKSQELQMADNRDFLLSLSDKESVIAYFRDKVRFERNLNTKAEIREALNISDTCLKHVLGSEATPLVELLYKAVPPPRETSVITCLKDIETQAVLEKYDYDLAKVEAVFRGHKSPNTRISKIMKRYRECLSRIKDGQSKTIDFASLLGEA